MRAISFHCWLVLVPEELRHKTNWKRIRSLCHFLNRLIRTLVPENKTRLKKKMDPENNWELPEINETAFWWIRRWDIRICYSPQSCCCGTATHSRAHMVRPVFFLTLSNYWIIDILRREAKCSNLERQRARRIIATLWHDCVTSWRNLSRWCADSICKNANFISEQRTSL